MSFNSTFSSVFSNTTNSYKFYWWLSVIDLLKDSERLEFNFSEIAFRMIARVWYPVNYFKLSFGRQDQLSKCVFDIKKEFNLSDGISEQELLTFLNRNKEDKFLQKQVRKLVRYVPYRFIRPWFSNEIRAKNDQEVNQYILDYQYVGNRQLPYYITTIGIKLNSEVLTGIKRELGLIESFTQYHLLKYLEKNNPNVPNLLLKSSRPLERKLSAPRRLWKAYVANSTRFYDIYTNKPLRVSEISIDHFLPWSFVTHDLLWNLHPVSKNINIVKSNSLPSIDYLPVFCELQYSFLWFLNEHLHKNALEDYYTTFQINHQDIFSWSYPTFKQKFHDLYLPKFEIAANMGFQSGWSVS